MAKYSNTEWLNAIRGEASALYQDNISLTTDETVNETIDNILGQQNLANEFFGILNDKIFQQLVNSVKFENPLSVFKKNDITNGSYIEEIFIKLKEMTPYNATDETEFFKRAKDELVVLKHEINRVGKYKTTLNDEMIKRAFSTEGGFNDLLSGCISNLDTSNEVEEYEYTSKLINKGIEKGIFKTEKIAKITEETTAKNFLAIVKKNLGYFKFARNDYNFMNVKNTADREDCYLLIRPDEHALIDVNALAGVFHLGKAETKVNTIIVDGLPANVPAILLHKNVLRNQMKHKIMKNMENGQNLDRHFYLHISQMIALSPLHNAIVFTYDDFVIEGYKFEQGNYDTTLERSEINLNQNSYTQLTLTSDTINAPMKSKMTLNGNNSSNTYLTDYGMLYVGGDEQGAITIEAVNDYDNNVTATIEITII